MDSSRLHRTCLSPLTVDYDDILSYIVDSYYMITSVITEKSSASKSTSAGSLDMASKRMMSLSGDKHQSKLLRDLQSTLVNTTSVPTDKLCGDQVVAPWGSLFPVYSKKQDLIFKNSVCADAYNVTDGVLWTPYLICQKYLSNSSFLNDGAAFNINADMKSVPKDCFIILQPPEHDLDSHMCYIDGMFINTCPEMDNMVLYPPYDLYRDEIRGACTSGLLSPYRAVNLYANVFCYICNEQYFRSLQNCPRTNEFWLNRSGVNIFGFVGLLDIDTIVSNKERKPNPKHSTACVKSHIKTNKEASCREILCPSGKSRDLDGSCRFSAKVWYIREYSLMVNISSTHGIDSRLFNEDLSALKNNWPKNWYIHQVLKEVNHWNMTMVGHLMVYFKLRYFNEDPNNILHEIDEVLNRQWALFKADQHYNLNVNYGNIRQFLLRAEGIRFIHPSYIEIVYQPAYRPVYRSMNFPLRFIPFFITKMYFCEQVELGQDEFILDTGMDVPVYILYNKLTGQYMYEAEFTLVYKDDLIVPRVCLDSSGLQKSTGTSVISTMYLCFGVILASVMG